jgi:hypothetical protein
LYTCKYTDVSCKAISRFYAQSEPFLVDGDNNINNMQGDEIPELMTKYRPTGIRN